MEARGVVDGALADRLALGVVARRAGSARPSPATTAASFQPRSTTSPMPVFMPIARSARADARRRRRGSTRPLRYFSATTLRRVQMLALSHSTSNGLPTARRISASLSMVSGVCLPSLSSTISRHMRVGRIDHADVGPQPAAIDGEEERARLLADALEKIRRAEEQMQRMAEHALPGQSDAELAADRALGAVAADEIVRLDALALAALEIDDLGADTRAVVLEEFKPRAVAQRHAGRGQREVAQDRVEPHLRAGLQPHRAP